VVIGANDASAPLKQNPCQFCFPALNPGTGFACVPGYFCRQSI